jgi:predicted MFS family arabinose efflux permease
LPGGDNVALIGLAMGMYGLSQACMQLPLGWASDKVGRKPVILAGLAVFALGCAWGAWANTVEQLVWARALQGAGAISAALSAQLADLTRDEVRSKGMAMIGASIGVTFALSLVLSPPLYRWVGLHGLFMITGVFSVLAMSIVAWGLPSANPEKLQPTSAKGGAVQVLLHPDLLRLNLGIFMLHLTQMALFVVVPGMLVHGLDLPVDEHWKVYLPVLLGSFLIMIPIMVRSEKHARQKTTKLAAIGLMALVVFGFALFSELGWVLVGLLFAYFVGFNLLEATLPSWVSRVAPPNQRGLALGVYNTSQALGLFAGGALGGLIHRHFGLPGVFNGILVCVVLWFVAALGLRALPSKPVRTTSTHL